MPRADGHVDLVITDENGSRRIGQIILQNAFFQTQSLDFGAPELLKQIDYIICDVTQKGSIPGLKLTIGWHERLSDPIIWGETYSISAANDPIFVRPPDSRYFVFKVEDTNVQAFWKFAGMQIHGRAVGARINVARPGVPSTPAQG